MKLNEIVYDILDLLRANITDNEEMDARQIAFWVKAQREFWVSNEIDKRGSKFLMPDSPFIQELDDIVVEIVDAGERAGLTSGVRYRRTEELPGIVLYHGGLAIEGIYPQCLVSSKIKLVPWNRFVNSGHLRFNDKVIYASYNANKIYFKQKASLENYAMLDKVKVSAMFEDPEDLKGYTNSDGNPAYTDDSDYPISGKFYENIKKAIINNNFQLVLSGKDSTNESAAI